MPRRTRPAAAGQQAKTVVEMCREPPHSKGLDPGRRQFDRQRYSIELQANLGNDRSVLVGEFKFPQTLRRALDKQLYRGKRKPFGGAKMVRWEAARQRRQPLHIFAFNPQRVAARCQDVDVYPPLRMATARVAAA